MVIFLKLSDTQMKQYDLSYNALDQWKRINRKQSARWQHLSWLKASAFLYEILLLGVKKHINLYLRLDMPYSGW